MSSVPVLEVRDLHVEIGGTEILRGLDFELEQGKTLGVVGESGCGKSMTGLTLMGMLPGTGKVTRGAILFEGQDLIKIPARKWQDIRGQDIALVMQDPFTSLNPMMRIGAQIAEVLTLHRGMGGREAWNRAIELLDKVGVPSPEQSARKYPHQLSGGQRQRVVIAIAFACNPKVLIADEPTTALDVTLQAQILRLIGQLQEETGTAVLLISHDIGVIAALSQRIAVFYAGRVVELGPADSVLRDPKHPYTRALLDALPSPTRLRLRTIGGQPPDFSDLPMGCSFSPRCPSRFEKCSEDPPLLSAEEGHCAACWLLELDRLSAASR